MAVQKKTTHQTLEVLNNMTVSYLQQFVPFRLLKLHVNHLDNFRI